MKKIHKDVTTYEIRDGYFVDVETTKENMDMWLYHNEYGVKVYMIGISRDVDVEEMLLNIIDQYIDEYEELYKY